VEVLVGSTIRVSEVVFEIVSTTMAVLVENAVTMTEVLLETVVTAMVVDVEMIGAEIGG
jgi:hypothetical protein